MSNYPFPEVGDHFDYTMYVDGGRTYTYDMEVINTDKSTHMVVLRAKTVTVETTEEL